MARKELFKSVLGDQPSGDLGGPASRTSRQGRAPETKSMTDGNFTPERPATPTGKTSAQLAAEAERASYALRGASAKMKASLDKLAEDARKLTEGETIVDISPDLIEGSFVSDRLESDPQAFEDLKQTISQSGQDSPVLLRPHPEKRDHYMVVFGHRRVRAARELERPVRAVIKEMDDVAHVLAQGQENTAREDLSFIEKALFAKQLRDLGHEKEVVQSALTIDATLLSRLLSVASNIPGDIISAIGAAKSVGRDRWEEMKKLVAVPANRTKALAFIGDDAFGKAESDERFELLLKHLADKGKPKQTAKTTTQKRSWAAADGKVKGQLARAGKGYRISLTAGDAADFGSYLADHLDELYRAYRAQAHDQHDKETKQSDGTTQ